mgnify:CR=1 FL=1
MHECSACRPPIISFWANNTSKSADIELKFGLVGHSWLMKRMNSGGKFLWWVRLGLFLSPKMDSFWTNNTSKSADFELKFGVGHRFCIPHWLNLGGKKFHFFAWGGGGPPHRKFAILAHSESVCGNKDIHKTSQPRFWFKVYNCWLALPLHYCPLGTALVLCWFSALCPSLNKNPFVQLV